MAERLTIFGARPRFIKPAPVSRALVAVGSRWRGYAQSIRWATWTWSPVERHAALNATDPGGMQKEAYFHDVSPA